MPEITSRISALALSGFQNVAYLIAVVYNLVRLIPDNHPYLNPRNIGRFGIRHVIAEAANNLKFSKANIDQILMFTVVLVGMALLALQLLILASSIILQGAHAAPPAPANWLDFFVVTNPEQDIAYIMLDLVFGVPAPGSIVPVGGGSFFGSCVGSVTSVCLDAYGIPVLDPDFTHPDLAATGVTTPTIAPLSTAASVAFPFPIHYGLHTLFRFYNYGLLIVGIMIACYFIATVVAETAQSGTPFGRRFNKLWAPIRIVMAFGLLMPLPSVNLSAFSMNSSQYLVLYAAKYGSAFATNGWRRFNTTLGTGHSASAPGYFASGPMETVSRPTTPEIEQLSLFMWLVNVCYHVTQMQTDPPMAVNGWVIGRQDRSPNTLSIIGASYDDVLNFLDNNPDMITIRFGPKNIQDYSKEDGNVKPYCGEIQIPLTDSNKNPLTNVPGAQPGPYGMQVFYYKLIQSMWEETGATSPYIAADTTLACGACGGERAKGFAEKHLNKPYSTPGMEDITMTYIYTVNRFIKTALDAAITTAVSAQMTANPYWLANMPCSGPNGPLVAKGWGAAGIWYNCIAEINGSMTTSVFAVPVQTKYPEPMEKVAALKAQYSAKADIGSLYDPAIPGIDDAALKQNLGEDVDASKVLYAGYKEWMRGYAKKGTSNKFVDAVSDFLGTSGLYDMRKNPNVHPLAQLVGIGRSLVEAAQRKLGFALGGAIGSRILNGADFGLLGVASSIMVTIAMLGLTAGFTLFYILPFLPFIYFFFALGGWVKAVFEAMLGAPLWALAHIRIDGHGLPGNAALNGYFLIFEIFIRPILTLFGLLASISIFSAMVTALNSIFDLVIYNVSGFNIEQEVTGPPAESVVESMRGVIDRFFFTVIYAIIVYMIGMSSFKLIDQIPNNILRWMGQSVSTFGDTQEDAAQGLMGRASMGAQQTFSKLGSGLSGAVSAISGPGKK